MNIHDYNYESFRVVVASSENLLMFTVALFVLSFFLVLLAIMQFLMSIFRKAEISYEHDRVVKERAAIQYTDSIIRDGFIDTATSKRLRQPEALEP